MSFHLVVAVGTPEDVATPLALANHCVGYFMGVPPCYAQLAQEQGWTLPCVITEDADGNVAAWAPAV